MSINAVKAVEIALDAMSKAGWHYPWATGVKLEGAYWIVIIDTIARKFQVKIDLRGEVVEIAEIKSG